MFETGPLLLCWHRPFNRFGRFAQDILINMAEHGNAPRREVNRFLRPVSGVPLDPFPPDAVRAGRLIQPLTQ